MADDHSPSCLPTAIPTSTRRVTPAPAVGGLIGGIVGTGAPLRFGEAEHQGPPGAGQIAVIARI